LARGVVVTGIVFTQQEQSDLRAVGFSDEQISGLTPQEAEEIIAAASVVVTNTREVREFLATITAQARAATKDIKDPGVLQMIRAHPLAKDYDDVVIYRYELNDPDLIERMTKDAVDMSGTGHNCYIETRTVRRGLRAWKRGELADTVAVFALAVDSDADKGKAWTPTVPTSLAVETSLGNTHFWFFFERAIGWGTAQKLGEQLRKATGGDHDTGVVTQPYRVAGTLNHPNKKKQARGRTEIVPTRVRGFDPETLWTPESFEQEFPPAPTPTNGGGNGQPTSEPDESSIPDETLEAIKSTEKGGRGNILWNVVQTLREDGWTVDGIITLLRRYPNGLANKFKGRLRREVERTWGKLESWQQGPSVISPPPSPPPPPPPPPGVQPGPASSSSVPPLSPLEQAHATFKRWLGASYDTLVLDVTLAAVACERMTGDPPWVMVISGPGNAKTETVQALAGAGALVTSTIASEGALLSGTARAPGATGGLLKRIGSHGVLVIKDFTSILSGLDRTARAGVMAALREIHDGFWERNLGIAGGRTLPWRGRIVVVAAVTTAWDTAHGVIAIMGDRFVVIRADSSKARSTSAVMAIHNAGREAVMRKELADAVNNVIAAMKAQPYQLSWRELRRLVKVANVVTMVRTGVERDYRGEVTFAHDPEMPTRFAKQLGQLVRGAVAIGKPHEEAMQLAERCARDSLVPLRWNILLDLINHPKSGPREVHRRVGQPRSTVRRELDALHALGVLVCEEQDKPFGWRIVTEQYYSVSPKFDHTTLRSLG
jgi:hypothetical protein